MKSLQEVFTALGKSAFRNRIRLQQKDLDYLKRKGMGIILEHAADFVDKRLAAADPLNDGKQTPWKGHPVFVAQHATATCCRGCLEKWHDIAKGRELIVEEKRYVVEAIKIWLSQYEFAASDEDVSACKNYA